VAVKTSAWAEIENANRSSARSEAVNPIVLLIVFSFRELSDRGRKTAMARLIDSRRQVMNRYCLTAGAR
jgi:hypothetical protein